MAYKIPKSVRHDLRKKYQPQWVFKTNKEAKKELKWQKEVNPAIYSWLIKKDIKVGKKRIPAKEIK